MNRIIAVYCVLAGGIGQAAQVVQVSDKFLDALEHVESGRDPNTKAGDRGASVGILQIQKIYVREACRISKRQYTYTQRTNVKASREMSRIVLTHWGRYFARKGVKITPAVLCSLHRQPSSKWTPTRMKSKLERGRTVKLLKYMKEHANADANEI